MSFQNALIFWGEYVKMIEYCIIKIEEVNEMKQAFEAFCEKSKLVGASCVVLNDTTIVEELYYGKSNLEKDFSALPSTVYRIASVSKVIVAMMFMKLVEENKASIDEDISTYLGYKVRNPHHPHVIITPKMLMTQTSSIRDGADDGSNGYNAVNGTQLDVFLSDLLQPEGTHYVADTYDIQVPGSKFIYSNFNCGILACIIEKISQKLFTSFVRDHLIKPLKIDASFRASDIMNEDIATLYIVNEMGIKVNRTKEDFVRNVYKDFAIGENYRGPAGGLFINVMDLSKIMKQFFYPTILKQETIQLMLSLHWQGIGAGNYRAKGLQLQILNDFENRTLKGHFGGAYGLKSFMLFNEQKKIGICFATNGGVYKPLPSTMAEIDEDVIRSFLDRYWQ